MADFIRAVLKGAVAGGAGTLAMTAWMLRIAPRVLPRAMLPRAFPPRLVVRWAEARTVGRGGLPEPVERRVTLAAHFAYGVAWGGVLGPVRNHVPRPGAGAFGAAYGLALWAVGYEGWLPLLGVQPATTDKPPRKWAYILIAHGIYGVTTALAYDRLGDRGGPRAPVREGARPDTVPAHRT